MEEDFSFTEAEVRAQLAKLGYKDVSEEKLKLFMIDLQTLIDNEKSPEDPSRERYGAIDSPSSSYFSNSNMSPSVNVFRSPLSYSERKLAFEKSKVPIFTVTGKENQPLMSGHAASSHNFNELSPLFENEKSDLSGMNTSDSVLNSTSDSQGKVKRKVARKRDGKTYVLDESSCDSSEGSDVTILEERLRTLPIRDYGRRHSEGSITCSSRDLPTAQSLPAFIRPATVRPHDRRIKKCDPVTRYHQFKNEWDYFKPPGENSRNNLRWHIRGQMLNHETFQRPQHQHAPNNYVVPTEKKRQSLRWQVRSNLAGS